VASRCVSRAFFRPYDRVRHPIIIVRRQSSMMQFRQDLQYVATVSEDHISVMFSACSIELHIRRTLYTKSCILFVVEVQYTVL